MAIREANPQGQYAMLPAGGDRRAPWPCQETALSDPPKASPPRPCPPGHRSLPLQPAYRESLRALDQTMHLLPRETPPRRDGGRRGYRVPDRTGQGKVAASTQNQALSAVLFLYREVLGVDLPWLEDVVRAKRPVDLPVVLTREEIRAVLQHLAGVPRLMAPLLHGAGLRRLECCRLRVKARAH